LGGFFLQLTLLVTPPQCDAWGAEDCARAFSATNSCEEYRTFWPPAPSATMENNLVKLRLEMQSAAANLDFEKAGQIRDQILSMGGALR
jgi:excinuclease UvrABC helicase subunit UvrB